MSSPANTNTNELSVKGLSKEERQNMRNEIKKNKELEKERMKLEKEAAKLKAKEDAKKAKEAAKAEKDAAKLKAKEDAKAEKDAAKLKAKEDKKAEKDAAKLKAKEDKKAEKDAAKLKAKEDAKAEKDAAKLKAKEDKKAEKDAAKLKAEQNTSSHNIDNSLQDFISQFKNHNLTLSNDVDFESFHDDLHKLVHFYLFTHLISNNSTSIESFKHLNWSFIYDSFIEHFPTFNNILKNNLQNNDIVKDLIYQANLNNNDIDIDVKLHVINGQKVLIDSQNVCYHFNHHKPIGKLDNNNIIRF